MGRPRRGTEELTEGFSCRLAKSIGARLRAKITEANMTRSEFMREIVDNDDNKIIVAQQPVSADKRQMLYLINKTGNNINQIAHRVNSDHRRGVISQATYRQLLAQLSAVEQYMNEALDRVA